MNRLGKKKAFRNLGLVKLPTLPDRLGRSRMQTATGRIISGVRTVNKYRWFDWNARNRPELSSDWFLQTFFYGV